jgi:hypothetical protein
MMRLFNLAWITMLVLAFPVEAQETARATISIERSLSIVSVRPIQLSPEDRVATLSLSAQLRPNAPAVIRVTGDPGRIYRIRVPRILTSSEGVALVEDLKIWSENTGDVSATRTSHMDMDGRDLLRVSGRLRPSGSAADTVAALPLSIDYE